jgi:hypothetical protein
MSTITEGSVPRLACFSSLLSLILQHCIVDIQLPYTHRKSFYQAEHAQRITTSNKTLLISFASGACFVGFRSSSPLQHVAILLLVLMVQPTAWLCQKHS